jgi:predicted Abi (CAAX) family protease
VLRTYHRTTNRLAQRVRAAITTAPGAKVWLEAALFLLLCGLLALPVGLLTGFFRVDLSVPWRTAATLLLLSLIFPAIAEELLFRVLFLPHPCENASTQSRRLWASVCWLLFVASHALKPFSLFAVDRAIFTEPIFLFLAGLLGLAWVKS